MNHESIDRVFGRRRLKMVTGPHVEVYREAAAPDEARRYTKRFLTTAEGDYAQWTEREWRILARLIGHGSRCVPDVVQYDRDAHGTKLVQTYDAGATVDQWATLLPVERDGRTYAHVFEDCAHWWALAHHCLAALDEIHSLGLVHLDVKGDNVCIPTGPADFDPHAPGARLYPVFRRLALIDFAFSLVSGESLSTPLPIGWQQDYDYQSPRLLRALEAGRAGDLAATERLDWRCDMYSLAAMLKRYLPRKHGISEAEFACGWTPARYDAAKSLILRLREAHDGDVTLHRPHSALLVETGAELGSIELMQSLERGWTLAADAQPTTVAALPLTPITRLAPPLRPIIQPPDEEATVTAWSLPHEPEAVPARPRPPSAPRHLGAAFAMLTVVAVALAVAAPFDGWGEKLRDASDWLARGARSTFASLAVMLGAKEHAAPVAASTGTDDAGPRSSDEAPESAVREDERVPDEARVAATASSGASAAPHEAAAPSPSASPAAAAPNEAAAPASSNASPLPSATHPRAEQAASPAATTDARRAKSGMRESTSSAVRSASRGSRAAEPLRRPPLASSGKASRNSEPPRSQLAAATRGGASGATVTRSRSSSTATLAAPAQVAAAASSPSSGGAPGGQRASETVAAAPYVESVAPASSTPSTALPPPTAPVTVAAPPLAPPRTAAAEPALAGSAESSRVASAEGPRNPAVDSSTAANDGRARASARTATGSPVRMAPIVDVSRVATTPAYPAMRAAAPAVTETPRAPSAEARTPSAEPPRTPGPEATGTTASEATRTPTVQPPRAPPAANEPRGDAAYLASGERAIGDLVPRSAAQAYPQVARVMWAASAAQHPAHERAVFDALRSASFAGADLMRTSEAPAPAQARRLLDESRLALRARRHAPEALDLAVKAFGADPRDPDVASHLASLELRVLPPQPERARQLALHAIAVRGSEAAAGRADDWIMLGIASALVGRLADARNAFYVSLALSRSADRTCRAVLAALAMHGERLRDPVDALVVRLHVQGRADDAPACGSPQGRVATRFF